MKRMTARDFRASFHKLEDPVLVGNGIWFPIAQPIHIALAEDKVSIQVSVEEAEYSGSTRVIKKADLKAVSAPDGDPTFVRGASGDWAPKDLSKKTQAKGRTRK